MIFKLSDLRKTFLYFVQGPKFYGGGGGGQTSTVTNQATIPDELKPYISTYMGAAEKQLYKTTPVTDPVTGQVTDQVTGFQPYKAYGATFDAQGNQTGYDPTKGIAAFSPMQQQAQTSAAGLSTGDSFGQAKGMSGAAGQGLMGSADTAYGYGAQGAGYGSQGAGIGMAAAGQAGQGYNAQGNFAQQITNPGTTAAYMSPYMQNVVNQQIGAANRQYDITGSQEMANATRANAFGGSREALMAAENERARNTAIGDIQAKGLQQAFTEAQGQQQFGANLGIQGLNAGTNAMQAGIQGAQTGIQGANTALQGVQTAQAGYLGANTAATTLGNLATQDLAAQTSILNTQNTLGAQQTAKDQAAKDQAILDYQNAMNKPMQDVGTMSNLVRGISTGSNTATTYAAQPSMGSQLGGLAATGLGAYSALKANGGIITDRGYANGGIVGYATGGSVEGSMRNKLEDLDSSHLQAIIKENESPEMTKLAKEVLATNYARGGIVGFASNDNGTDTGSLVTKTPEQIRLEKNLAASKAASQKGLSPIETQETIPVETTPVANPVLAVPNVQQGIVPNTAPTIDESMGLYQQDIAKLREAAAKPEEQLMAEDKKRRDAVLGEDTATIEYRKKIMEERANAPDEARRQMGMRLMEFGANWASTPGAPLVAGMKALKEGLPDFMADTKANKKAMKEVDASIYALDHADRLEKAGYLDRAAAMKEKASDSLMKATPQLVDAAYKKETLAEQARSHKATEGLQGAQNAQTAAYQTGVLAQPSAAKSDEAYVTAAIAKGTPEFEARAMLEAAKHPRTSGALAGEKALTTLYNRSNIAAQEAEKLAAFGGQEEKNRAITLRATANKHELELVNAQRERNGLEPLESLTQTSPRNQITTAAERPSLSSFKTN